MAVETTTTLSEEMKSYYDLMLLDRAMPNIVHGQFGQPRPLSRRQGNTINFRRFDSLAVATTALTEGTPPSGSNLSVTEVTATIAQYGDFVKGSDLLDYTAVDPVITETIDVQGQQAGESIDTVFRDIIAAGTSVQYANDATSRVTVDSTDLLTVTEVRKAVRTLKGNNARQINGRYVAIVHPNSTYTLQEDSEWKDASKYAGSTTLFNGELGEVYGVRFVESTLAKVFTGAGASSIDVYATLVFGMNAYGIIPLDGAGLEFYLKGLGSAGTADPLDQNWTAGWKATTTAKVLNDLFITRIEHAVSS